MQRSACVAIPGRKPEWPGSSSRCPQPNPSFWACWEEQQASHMRHSDVVGGVSTMRFEIGNLPLQLGCMLRHRIKDSQSCQPLQTLRSHELPRHQRSGSHRFHKRCTHTHTDFGLRLPSTGHHDGVAADQIICFRVIECSEQRQGPAPPGRCAESADGTALSSANCSLLRPKAHSFDRLAAMT